MLYCHLLIHVEIYIYMLDTYRRNELIRCKHKRRKDNDKDAGRIKTQEDFFNNILPFTLLQGFERVIQGLHVRGSWGSNRTVIFWPHCYDRDVVSFLFSKAAQPLLAGLQGYIAYPHIAAVCMFELVVLLLLGDMWGSIGVHHWWVSPCFSSSDLHVWFV